MKKLLLIGLVSLFTLNIAFSQTSLTLGDIAFTSYNADGIDDFTFVLLTDVTSGTTITFTNNGWYHNGGFQQGEETCTLTFGQAYTCGSQITISSTPFQALDNNGSSAGSMNGMPLNLSSAGDQIFAYQGNLPWDGNSSNFISAIQMNGESFSSATDWDYDASSSYTSGKPSVFTSGLNVVWLGASEVDNAQYNCSTVGMDAATIRAAVNNPANWNTDNSVPFSQPPPCSFSCSTVSGVPYLSMVNPITNQVTISNCSSTDAVDITGYRLCSELTYVTISSGMVVSGSLNIPGSGSVVLSFAMDETGADLGFYEPTGSFTSTTAMLDFTQWGTAGNGRESVAVSKGIWAAGTAAPGGAPYTYGGVCETNYGMGYWNGTGIIDAAPGCTTFSMPNVTGADAWFNITDGSGNTIASVNPNGNDLGTVSVDFNDLAASPQNGNGEFYIPRSFNFTSSTFNGSGMPFANGGVHIRLYYLDAELAAYNTANASTETSATLVIRHYHGADEDCDVTNNAGAGDVVSTNASAVYSTNGFYVEFTAPHFSEMSGSGPPTLAIDLQNFTGVAKGTSNVLHWTTSNEANSKTFLIERLSDDNQFETIGKVAAAGDSNVNQNYKFTDSRVASTLSYYRLVELDQIGERTVVSEVIAITNNNQPIFTLAPNPTKGNLRLSFTLEITGTYDVIIYDLMGREVLRNTIQTAPGFNQLEANTKELNTGMYLLKVQRGQSIIYAEKFIKQ